MKRVLVLGGYGVFGERIATRLADAGYETLVAGRSLARAREFCAGRPGLVPLALDREQGIADALALHAPFALIDAAGPFQGLSYAVPRACIAAGCHYIDIADGRDFVAGIGSLDDAARARGLCVVSGASSVPALSGAIARTLADGLSEVRSVEMAIGASNRASVGPSVTQAILFYVGKPIRVWRAGRWTQGFGWQDMRVERFAMTGSDQLGARLVALADTPDLVLLPDRLPGRPSVVFRAGTELALDNLAVWLLSWPVRWGVIGSLAPIGPVLLRLHSLMKGWGSDRSGMSVRLLGLESGRRIERRWTLIASDGCGAQIPALASPILVDMIAAGALAPGARDAGGLLTLDHFERVFARMSIRHETVETECAPSLYARVMGTRFDALPPPVRAMHDVHGNCGARGKATVARGRHPLARLVAWLFRLPLAGEHELHVALEEREGRETWTRDFSGRAFRSHMSEWSGFLVERFGPIRFAFDLASETDGLSMRMRRWWFGPIPLPLAWAPRSLAREWEEDGKFRFDVPISAPIVGMIVHYRGWLIRIG